MKLKKIITYTIISIVIIMSTGAFINDTFHIDNKEKYKTAKNFKNGKFINPIETLMKSPKFSVMMEFFKKGYNRFPDYKIKTQKFNKSLLNNNDSLSFSWFGHSSILLRLEGKNILLDPIFKKRVSMVSFIGPKRFDYTHYVDIEQLPEIDIIAVSHDHYDHLEKSTMKKLKNKVKKFMVPLGVEQRLIKWGIPKEKITTFNWWDSSTFNNIEFTLTPTRHFSGRGLSDRFETLWGAWVIKGKEKSVYFSGDSGYFPGFKEVGEKYKTFDLAFIECGQYNKEWHEIHMMPEESAKVGKDINAKQVVPIHWGKFKLSLHEWTEPIKRFLNASKNYDYNVILPEINEVVDINKPTFKLWFLDEEDE